MFFLGTMSDKEHKRYKRLESARYKIRGRRYVLRSIVSGHHDVLASRETFAETGLSLYKDSDGLTMFTPLTRWDGTLLLTFKDIYSNDERLEARLSCEKPTSRTSPPTLASSDVIQACTTVDRLMREAFDGKTRFDVSVSDDAKVLMLCSSTGPIEEMIFVGGDKIKEGQWDLFHPS